MAPSVFPMVVLAVEAWKYEAADEVLALFVIIARPRHAGGEREVSSCGYSCG